MRAGSRGFSESRCSRWPSQREREIETWLQTSPNERLDWLEEALRFARDAGVLDAYLRLRSAGSLGETGERHHGGRSTQSEF